MTTESSTLDPILAMAVSAARAADDKKAIDVAVLSVGPIVAIYEYLIIASAPNPRLVSAIAQSIEDQLAAEFDRRPLSVEGLGNNRWILADYGDIVVHVFHEEERAFYRLERLFGDAPKIDWAAEHPQLAPEPVADPA